MSESIVRKVQPFTIGTKLSAPSVSKGQEFTAQSYLAKQSLEGCGLQHNLNSLYLSRSQARSHGPPAASQDAKPAAPVRHKQEPTAAEDDLNQNGVSASASAVSRSIKKITISGSQDKAENSVTGGLTTLSTRDSLSENNNNNNNISNSSPADPHLPRIVRVSCENMPNSQFKIFVPELLKKSPLQKESQARTQCEGREAAALHNDGFTQCNSLFTKEVQQAEAWIKGKLQALKDGWDTQCCPLQEWEEASQTLQRDLKDFENTLIQLNQMGEQLICKLNPTSEVVKKQLSHLRDQWQSLKQMAANETQALSGAKSLQEFNEKVDKLEAWIKEKEEEQSLVNVLRESVDKMQLTRRILDLKQDEQQHRNLHEEINQLALKLEKQGKADSKNISSRKKHINKMWLKVQTNLQKYQENLYLALEVSSFYQQADNTLQAINDMRRGISPLRELERFGEREIRDIAGQVMILDVSVSQLSNLHPTLAAGITKKQREVKDAWALLQRDFRGDRTLLSPCDSTFTREDADPLNPAQEPQCSMGTEAHAIMGKEVKEERNRLKGCAIIDCGREKRSQEQRSVNHASPSVAVGMISTKEESRKSRSEPNISTATTGHVQLQRFTVSADKTLSWLRDNVTVATQVCSIASVEGLEAARRCHHSLEQEILSNRARIEVVKREGHGLVRAQHPGSAKIEEFLSQLEVLWEELRRRHQRNAVFLQASKELGFRVVKVLQALGSLAAWLESVELSMKESALAGDPETMSLAERESCLLEREVAARSPELSALKREVERLHGQSHPHTRGLPERMEEVERKYHRVLTALTQQSSELQDTRMLTEFLERVELEDSQESTRGQYSLGQPLHRDMSSAPTLFELQTSGDVEPLIESIADPVEELREAVEMLNDTVRRRGRSQSYEQAVQELLSKHASLAVRVEECLCCSKTLHLDIQEKQTDMAVQCELDLCGLEALQEKQDHLETDYRVISEEVVEMQNRVLQLKEMCPERVHILEAKIQATLQVWEELGRSMTENKGLLQKFEQLRDFFRSYLAMISWTEDTRSKIFIDAAPHSRRVWHKPAAAELDFQIQRKFEEFDVLAITGTTLLDKEHHLAHTVRERMEELRSMLGWISVHWKAQKQQWQHKSSTPEPQENLYSVATMCLPWAEQSTQSPAAEHATQSAPLTGARVTRYEAVRVSDPPASWKPITENLLEDGYEIMNSIGCQDDSPKANVLVLKESASQQAVNLILSFGNSGDSQVQVLDLPSNLDPQVEEPPEPVHRVSTYLHVKDNDAAVAPVYESIAPPCQKSCSARSVSPCVVASSSSSQPSFASGLLTSNVTFHPFAGSSSSGSIFSSLKRTRKKRKRKRDARRHTIQKIMGVDEPGDERHHYECETITYDTRTWPLKEKSWKRTSPHAKDGADDMFYMRNPLLADLDTVCSGDDTITPYAVSAGPSARPTVGPVKGHFRFLSLGSVLSFDLPKDVSLIPSIQDIITIAPPESKKGGTDVNPQLQSRTVLSSFKQKQDTPPVSMETHPSNVEKDQPGNPVIPSSVLPMKSGEDLNDPSKGPSAKQERDKEPSGSECTTKELTDKSQTSQMNIYVNHNLTTTRVTKKHQCISVHTRIQDLNGHLYHKCPQSQCKHEQRAGHQVTQAALKVNVKAAASIDVRQDSTDSGFSTASSLKLSTEAPSTGSRLKGVVGRVLSVEVGGLDYTKAAQSEASPEPPIEPDEAKSESIHPNHQQFEEEEEELENIWNQTTSHRQSICSDIMYRPNQDDLTVSNQVIEPYCCPTRTKNQSDLYRELVTSSAPDLLVAEFKLPPHIHNFLGYDRNQDPEDQLSPLAKRDRRSWAAFSVMEATSRASVATNETMSGPIKLPDVADSLRYVYQYKEEEEEEEEEEQELEDIKVGEQVEEFTGCSKDPSTSVLSLQLSKDTTPPSSPDKEAPKDSTSTGGRCFILSGKPELQSMEGTLERKQRLQLGGKKAASRGWNSYHTVLYRNTMCFFQDRKDTLRSSACGLPLNLMGAECSPAPDYTKKPHCFRLRLRDGSEYLFNASSQFMMKKWITKVQASTGQNTLSSSTQNVDQAFPAFRRTPPVCFKCHSETICHCSSQHDVNHTVPVSTRHKLNDAARVPTAGDTNSNVKTSFGTTPAHKPAAKEIVVLTRPQSHLRNLDEQSTITSSKGGRCDDGTLAHSVTHRISDAVRDHTSSSTHNPVSSREGWLSNKGRSHSFTSATYQRIKPMSHCPAGESPQKASNYSVTLLLGDKSAESSLIGRNSGHKLSAPAAWKPESQQEPALKSFASLQRPTSKSVFKKIFGKKEL